MFLIIIEFGRINQIIKKIIYLKIKYIITKFNFIFVNTIFLFYTCSAEKTINIV